jgi:hypothetical protein
MRFSNELDAPCDKDVQMGLTRHALGATAKGSGTPDE